MSPRDALLLGRVSNLPTLWTNLLAGLVLAGGAVEPVPFVVLGLALSSLYVGGMYLNDAFDRHWDAAHRPERPIPSGRVTARTVFASGFTFLALGVAGAATVAGPGGVLLSVAVAAGLAGTILFYDLFHKGNPLAPLVMGACRVGVYAVAAYSVSAAPPAALWIGAAALLAWLIGLTYAARQENLARMEGAWPLALLAVPVAVALASSREGLTVLVALGLAVWAALAVRRMLADPPDIGGGVARLIAGISGVDALLIASLGETALAIAALAAVALTRLFQRVIPGT